MPSSLVAIGVLMSLAGKPEPSGEPLGGYWQAGEWRPPEPKDGDKEILAGSILVPLGLISAASGAITAGLTAPDSCRGGIERLSLDEKECRPLFIFGLVRVGYGGLMLASGAVLLGLGVHHRQRHRSWKQRYGFRLGPWFAGRGGGIQLQMALPSLGLRRTSKM